MTASARGASRRAAHDSDSLNRCRNPRRSSLGAGRTPLSDGSSASGVPAGRMTQTARSGPRGEATTVYSPPRVVRRASAVIRWAIDLRVSCRSNAAMGAGQDASNGFPSASADGRNPARSQPPPWATTMPSRLTSSARSGSASTSALGPYETALAGGASVAALARRGVERFAEMRSLPGLSKNGVSSRPGAFFWRAKSSRSRPIESGTQLAVATSMRRKREVRWRLGRGKHVILWSSCAGSHSAPEDQAERQLPLGRPSCSHWRSAPRAR
jgi:hypothetical protein